MATIFEEIGEELVALNEAKQNIKTALESKGQDLTDVPFTQYADKINAISGGGNDVFIKYLNNNINRLDLPEGVEVARSYLCYNQRHLHTITLPSNIKKIESNAFSSAPRLIEIINLSSLSIPSNAGKQNDALVVKNEDSKLITIQDGFVFFKDANGKYKLIDYAGEYKDTLVFPNSYNNSNYEIRDYCLYYGANFRKVIIPNDITSIPKQFCMNAENFEEIELHDGITTFGANAFSYTKLKSFVNPPNVTKLDQIFYNCTELTNVDLGNVQTLAGTFAGCTGLTSLVLPETLTTIGSSSIVNTGLTKLTLPTNITRLGSYACQNNSKLKEVVFKGDINELASSCLSGNSHVLKYDFTHCTSVPKLSSSSSISGSNNCKIYVPDDLYDTWKTTTNWTTHASKIYKASEMPAE